MRDENEYRRVVGLMCSVDVYIWLLGREYNDQSYMPKLSLFYVCYKSLHIIIAVLFRHLPIVRLQPNTQHPPSPSAYRFCSLKALSAMAATDLVETQVLSTKV